MAVVRQRFYPLLQEYKRKDVTVENALPRLRGCTLQDTGRRPIAENSRPPGFSIGGDGWMDLPVLCGY